MKALTIWQPWASLIAIGAKHIEFRKHPGPVGVRGRRFIVHAGIRQPRDKEIAELLNSPVRLARTLGIIDRQAPVDPRFGRAMDLLDRAWCSRTAGRELAETLPVGAALATAVLGQPRICTELFAGLIPESEIDPDMWAWPLTDVKPLQPIVPMKGAQGFWNWPADEEWLVKP